MRKDSLHIVFAGGGTAGHLFPGLAVAEQLSAAILACGSRSAAVASRSRSKPWRTQALIISRCRFGASAQRPGSRSLRGQESGRFRAAKQFMRAEHVTAVIGLGGYASVPMGRAAIRRGVPLVLLETKRYARQGHSMARSRATLVCTAFDATGETLRLPLPDPSDRQSNSVWIRPRHARQPFDDSRLSAGNGKRGCWILGKFPSLLESPGR